MFGSITLFVKNQNDPCFDAPILYFMGFCQISIAAAVIDAIRPMHVIRVGTFWRLRDTSLANKSLSLELFKKFPVEINLTMYDQPLKAKKLYIAFRISSQMGAKVTK